MRSNRPVHPVTWRQRGNSGRGSQTLPSQTSFYILNFLNGLSDLHSILSAAIILAEPAFWGHWSDTLVPEKVMQVANMATHISKCAYMSIDQYMYATLACSPLANLVEWVCWVSRSQPCCAAS